MRILITGNTGYIGPSVLQRLRQSYPQATLIGLDKGYFAHCLTNAEILPECRADVKYFADVRILRPEVLQGVDAIAHVAAISNDPISKTFADATYAINFRAGIELATRAKAEVTSCSLF